MAEDHRNPWWAAGFRLPTEERERRKAEEEQRARDVFFGRREPIHSRPLRDHSMGAPRKMTNAGAKQNWGWADPIVAPLARFASDLSESERRSQDLSRAQSETVANSVAGAVAGRAPGGQAQVFPFPSFEGRLAEMGVKKPPPAAPKVSPPPPPKPARVVLEPDFGLVAETFETRGRGLTTISDGKGDPGGKSYGRYQLSSTRGAVDEFLTSSGYSNQLGKFDGSPEFDQKWLQLVADDPEFTKAQKAYVLKTYYGAPMTRLKSGGIDLENRGRAVREMVLSTSIQYGQNSHFIEDALKGRDVGRMTDFEIIGAVQDHKLKNLERFGENQRGARNRMLEESKMLWRMDVEEKIPDPLVRARAGLPF